MPLPYSTQLHLPFACHFTEANDNNPACTIIWTTYTGEDTLDHVAVVDVAGNDPTGQNSLKIAKFITDALNSYVQTKEGLEAWKKVHPIVLAK